MLSVLLVLLKLLVQVEVYRRKPGPYRVVVTVSSGKGGALLVVVLVLVLVGIDAFEMMKLPEREGLGCCGPEVMMTRGEGLTALVVKPRAVGGAAADLNGDASRRTPPRELRADPMNGWGKMI